MGGRRLEWTAIVSRAYSWGKSIAVMPYTVKTQIKHIHAMKISKRDALAPSVSEIIQEILKEKNR